MEHKIFTKKCHFGYFDQIPSLHGRIRVNENPYSHIFYIVDPYKPLFWSLAAQPEFCRENHLAIFPVFWVQKLMRKTEKNWIDGPRDTACTIIEPVSNSTFRTRSYEISFLVLRGLWHKQNSKSSFDAFREPNPRINTMDDLMIFFDGTIFIFFNWDLSRKDCIYLNFKCIHFSKPGSSRS